MLYVQLMLEEALADAGTGLLVETISGEPREQAMGRGLPREPETGRNLWPRDTGWVDEAG